jgi:hypothetical protein
MNYKTVLLFTFLALTAILNRETAYQYNKLEKPHSEASLQELAIPEVVIATLNPALVPICTCESGQGTGKPQQFNIYTGEVLRGKINNKDTGMCQINTYYHEADAIKMGLDIFTEQGNIIYANYVYKTQGSQPWSASSACWGKGVGDTGSSSIMK